MNRNIITFDIGTTRLKTVYKIDGEVHKETYSNHNPNTIIKKLCSKHPFDCIAITGSGARRIRESKDYIYLNELECTAYMVQHMNLQEAIVVNVGTGTSFIQYKNGAYQHITGTGIGGGTFTGLGKRLLGISEPADIEALALQGDLKRVNILIEDIYQDGLGWLQKDITVSNFGKETGKSQDVALGIHSLVTDVIISILAGIVAGNDVHPIILSGGVMENQLMKQMLTRYADLFHLDCQFFSEPSYGTCYGALAILENKKLW
ncbi:hypothetical protein HZI73_04495 [Vallitalea pronyensis]|uniref:Pantothenate kinase n=1 Tax=Vallitalea pronyensis TaxID=1348613 RepID=A0A8J8SFF5_9FIRM|nr:hypothetical protein [Vallitalea pronyensis]QUI21595.1 hypothetical protein HZI73_04495 [Vallitalea pronyensis]